VKYVLLFVDTEQFASDLQTMGLAERERAFQQADKWFGDHVGKLRGGSRLRSPGFDVTGSQFGVMLVPDQPRALREMVRVTRPGGRVLVIADGSPAELEFLQVFIGALTAVAPEFPGLPDDPPPLEFQVSDPDVLHRRLTDAGLKDVRVERTAERPAFTSGQEMWDWVLYGNPIPGMLVADLTEDQRARLRQVLDGMLRERAGANGRAVLENAVNIGIGTK
jgi:SAM-dependent methyltransferase